MFLNEIGEKTRKLVYIATKGTSDILRRDKIYYFEGEFVPF